MGHRFNLSNDKPLIDPRRRKLLMVAALSSVASITGVSWATYRQNNTMKAALIGNALGTTNTFYSVVADWQGNAIHRIPLPERAHGVAISQQSTMGFSDAVAFARRPGHFFQVFDYQTGEEKVLMAAHPDRHFYGHGVFSQDGRWLLATEGVRGTSQGLIGVYDVAAGYQKVDEWHGIGIGPHEIIRLDDGSYAVGVGGVHTLGRKPLNLETMQPSLTRLNCNGAITCQVGLSDKKLSIRHLGYNHDGVVLCGQQYRGEPDDYPALIAMQEVGGELTNLNAEPEEWARFNHYVASIAVVDDYVLATSPLGNCYGIWSISQNRLLELNSLTDASGAISHSGYFYISSGSGETIKRLPLENTLANQSHILWDNHWTAIPK